MGSDNLYHKRKQEAYKSLKRTIIKREQYKAVLIVCEGMKTEPNYFTGLCESLKLNRANIQIKNCPNGNDPLNIAKYAFDKKGDYDCIFCVFDKEHTTYQTALEKLKTHNQKKRVTPILAITSVPCFEFWLLLHFVDTTKPYNQKGNKSPADQLMSELKAYIPGYSKGHESIFEKTSHLLESAITRAKRIDELQKQNGTDNPSTKVYQVVRYLQSIHK